MRILFVFTRADTFGGVPQHILEMSSALLRDGHQVLVVCGAGDLVTAMLADRSVPFRSLPYFRRSPFRYPISDFRTFLALRQAISEFQPNLVSTHTAKGGLLGRIAARSCGVPCIFTAHGWSAFAQVGPLVGLAGKRVERILGQWSARILNVSEDGSHRALDMGLPAEKVMTIHNGRGDVPMECRAVHSDRHPVIVTMVGRMEPPKDQALLLRAAFTVGGCRIQLIGDGPQRQELEALAEQLNMTERVRFLGRRGDIAPLLAASDVFCLASRSEGFPRSTLEAMRAGLPVVVSDVGGSREAVRDGETGFVVPPRDPDGFADKLRQLVKNPSLRSQMGSAARRLYEERFTFDAMYKPTLAVYEDVLREVGVEA